MIDLPNYKACLLWLERSLATAQQHPEDKLIQEGLAHPIAVTYNLTEAVLRQAAFEMSYDSDVHRLSSGELMRYAIDFGLELTTPRAWLTYGLAIEQVRESFGDSFEQDLLPLLPQYMADLNAFARRLEGRLIHLAA